MTIRLGVVMDPIASIHYKKDSTLAMLWEAKARGFELYYFELNDLFLRDGVPYGDASQLDVFHDAQKWYALGNKETMPLAELDIILMRKDPPFSEEYIYATYILEHAERLGVLVANRPQSLRDSNEKLFATHFPQCCPPALVTQSIAKLHAFWQEHKDIVCKPLNIMGGASVFRLREGDVNAQVIFEILTSNQSVYIMAQRYIPDIINGDKRIIMIDGEAVPYALARVPQGKDWRGNLAAGAKGIVQALTDRDRWICSQVGPELKSRGLYFVGISPAEKNPIILLGTIGKRGPSSFVFEPVYHSEFDSTDIIKLREQLQITQHDLAKALDISQTTLQRIEAGTSRDLNTLKFIQIFLQFPEVALWQLKQTGSRVPTDVANKLRKYFESKDRK